MLQLVAQQLFVLHSATKPKRLRDGALSADWEERLLRERHPADTDAGGGRSASLWQHLQAGIAADRTQRAASAQLSRHARNLMLRSVPSLRVLVRLARQFYTGKKSCN